jgi:sugar transferase (PEP-CTERM/EpsH1 system associated)
MRILWLKTELLHPVDKGGRIRTYQMLRALRREHHVVYLTLDNGGAAPDAAERAEEYCHELERIPFHETRKDSPRLFADLAANLLSPLPYAVAKYRSAQMRRRVTERVARGDLDMLVCDFLFPSQNVPSGLPCPTVLFQHNVEAEIWRRHTEVAQSAVRRGYFKEQWRRMERFEGDECRRFDHVIAVSDADAELMRSRYRLAECASVPTGVDTEYFSPEAGRKPSPLELVFTGALDWMPNEDAIEFFANEVLPLVHREERGATLTVVGRNPTARLKALASRQPALTLAGAVPDVRPYMNRAAAFIVPIRVGGGTRLKIFEAMAMELPVVTTTVGAEGLPVTPGTHAQIADTAPDFAAAVVTVLRERERAREMAVRAAAHVRANFGWDRVAEQFAAICATVAARSRRPEAA